MFFCVVGVLDVDPCFAWNCQVVAGVGVARDIRHLYHDMHSYLAGAPSPPLSLPSSPPSLCTGHLPSWPAHQARPSYK